MARLVKKKGLDQGIQAVATLLQDKLFATPAERQAGAPDVKALHAKIGQLAMENDFLAGALGRIPDASAKR